MLACKAGANPSEALLIEGLAFASLVKTIMMLYSIAIILIAHFWNFKMEICSYTFSFDISVPFYNISLLPS
jgi:hypothetical protein